MNVALPLRDLAPAKLNLCLYVGGRRGDGLHEICSIFHSVSLCDEVALEEIDGERDEVHCPGVKGRNIAATALERFRDEFGLQQSALRVTIHKRIPVAAGLGGGSSDAAAVLRMAAALRGLGVTKDYVDSRLASLAMSIGADVPSQLVPGACLVEGAGERIERLEPSQGLAALLVASRSHLSTAKVYARADELGLPDRQLGSLAAQLRDLAGRDGIVAGLGRHFHNDLQAAALDLEPSAGRAIDLLREAGAEHAFLSGSGPTAVGLFGDTTQAEQAKREIERSWRGELFVVTAVAG